MTKRNKLADDDGQPDALQLAMSQRDVKLSRPQAARYIGVSAATLATDASRPRMGIPYFKVGSRVLYAKSDLDAFLQRNRIDPSAA